jgi:hypothetical protein
MLREMAALRLVSIVALQDSQLRQKRGERVLSHG